MDEAVAVRLLVAARFDTGIDPLLYFALDPPGRAAMQFYWRRELSPLDRFIDAAPRFSADIEYFL